MSRATGQCAGVVPAALIAWTLTATPSGVVLGPDANIWFPEQAWIGKLSTSGRLEAQYPLGLGAQSTGQIVVGPDGALWFGELERIGRITTGGTLTAYPTPTGASYPFNLAVGSDGAVWFAERNGNTIGRIAPPGP